MTKQKPNLARTTTFVMLCAFVAGVFAIGSFVVRGQTLGYILAPGESIEIVAATCEVCPTCAVPTPSPEPDRVYMMARTESADWPEIANLGVNLVNLEVQRYTKADVVTAHLDDAQALGLRVIPILNGGGTLNRPWRVKDGEWTFESWSVEVLEGIAGHPALYAIYAMHEPIKSYGVRVAAADMRSLYQRLKVYTNGARVHVDIESTAKQVGRGYDLTGMMDTAGTYRYKFLFGYSTDWSLGKMTERIDADIAARDEHFPGIEILCHMQAYEDVSYGSTGLRLPKPDELRALRDYLCDLGEPVVYYPWTPRSSYDITLKQAPSLWPVVSEGCK